MRKNRSTNNNTKMKTKTPKNNNLQIINYRNYYNFYQLNCSLSIKNNQK